MNAHTTADVSEADPPTAPWPSCARAAYHGLAGDIVRAVDPHTEADPVGVLVSILVWIGNAIGRGPHVRVESTRHRANLFAVLVGATSSGRKGTAGDHVRFILERAEPEWAENNVTSGLASGEGLIHAVRDAVKRREPVRERGRVVDYQDVVEDPGVADKRLLVIEPEFARLLSVASRNGSIVSAVLREAWERDVLRNTTRNNPAKATGAHISLIGHVTQDELVRSLGSTEHFNGFANRFLWVAVRRSKLLPNGGGFPATDVQPLVDRTKEVLSFARSLGDLAVERDETASAMWNSVYGELTSEKRGLSGAAVARGAPQVLRLAMLYALLDCRRNVGADHLRAALGLWEYVEASAVRIFGRKLGDEDADEVLRVLRETPGGLTRSDLIDHFSRHIRSPRLNRVLNDLERLGLVQRQVEPTRGRPAERWMSVLREESEQGET